MNISLLYEFEDFSIDVIWLFKMKLHLNDSHLFQPVVILMVPVHAQRVQLVDVTLVQVLNTLTTVAIVQVGDKEDTYITKRSMSISM